MGRTRKDPSNTNIVSESCKDQPNLSKIVNNEFKISVLDMLDYASREQKGLAEIARKIFFDGKFTAELEANQKPEYYKYNGVFWEIDSNDEHCDFDESIAPMLDLSIAELSKDEKNYKAQITSLRHDKHLINTLRSKEEIAKQAVSGRNGCGISHAKWDNYVEELTTPTGIVDLKTGTLRDSLPEDYRRLHTNTDFIDSTEVGEPEVFLATLRDMFSAINMPKQEENTAEKKEENKEPTIAQIDEFLTTGGFSCGNISENSDQISNNDVNTDLIYQEKLTKWKNGEYREQMVDFFQKLLGYMLLGTNKEQKFVIFVGDRGRNGKGVITHTLMNILGNYAASTRSETFMKTFQSNSSNATPEIIKLDGVRIVVGDENDRGDKLNATLLKRATGGDLLSGRNLYKGEITFKPKFVPLLLTNYFP